MNYELEHINELIRKYSEGTISKEERFELEKYALEDPMLFEALQGYSSNSILDSNSKWKAIEKQIIKDKASRFYLPTIWRVAAGLLILLAAVIGFQFINLQSPTEDDLVLMEQEEMDMPPTKERSQEMDQVEITEFPVPQTQVNTQKSPAGDEGKNAEVIKEARKETSQNETASIHEEERIADSGSETTAKPKAGISSRSAMNYDIPESGSIQLTGKILDTRSRIAIPGTKILIASSQISTLSDSSGLFHLSLPYDADTLIFEKFGYQVLRIKIPSQDYIEIRLIPLN